mgnify:FL=1|jgi:hypothetical protein
MKDDLGVIEAYARLDDSELYSDFESVVSDVLDAKAEQHSFTSSQLPGGFESEPLEGRDFGFYAEKTYEGGEIIEVEYSESSDIGFGAKDSSSVSVSVGPEDYEFSEIWDQSR